MENVPSKFEVLDIDVSHKNQEAPSFHEVLILPERCNKVNLIFYEGRVEAA
jgi:hypothetical protein